jgi:hypothetical protein
MHSILLQKVRKPISMSWRKRAVVKAEKTKTKRRKA